MTPFPLPVVFAAWGFRNGGAVYSDAAGLANLCNANGIKTVAVQLGDAPSLLAVTFGISAPKAGSHWTERFDVETLRRAGLHVILWGVADPDTVRSELARLDIYDDDWHPQIEGPGQRNLVLAQDHAGIKTPSIVTTYSGAGDTPGEAAALRDAGVEALLVECYPEVAPWFSEVDRILAQGQTYGWNADELYPLLGTYRGEMPSTFSGLDHRGRDWGLYLAEPMSLEQWRAFGAVKPTPEPQPEPEAPVPAPVKDVDAKATVIFASHSWEQSQTEYKPRARLVLSRRICDPANVDSSWTKPIGLTIPAGTPARDAVKAILDDIELPL